MHPLSLKCFAFALLGLLFVSCGPPDGHCVRPPVEPGCREIDELDLTGAKASSDDLEICRFECLRVKMLRLNAAVSRPRDLPVVSRIRSTGSTSVEAISGLVDLTGFPSVDALTSLNVHSAPSLRELGELPPNVLRSVRLKYTRLTSLAGLSQQTSLDYVYLESNSLATLEGLPKALTKPLTLEIQRDAALQSTAALSGVHISDLGIFGATELRSLEGLDASTGLERLTIMNNPNLPQCEALALAQRLGLSAVNIRNNKPCP
jgi:hypothetical protein